MTQSDQQENKYLNIKEEIKSLAFIALIAIIIRIFLIEPFFIPSWSMQDTLRKGDYVFATKYNYGYGKNSFLFLTPQFMEGRLFGTEPERGDIVIFKTDKRYIKRLIGLPGDKIQMIGGVLYINNKPIERRFLKQITTASGEDCKIYREILPNGVSYNALYAVSRPKVGFADNTEAFFVPIGHYFMMGDNRNDSNDSRLGLGFIPFYSLIAKAQFIFFSASEYLWNDDNTSNYFVEPIKWVRSIQWNRIFKNIYVINENY